MKTRIAVLTAAGICMSSVFLVWGQNPSPQESQPPAAPAPAPAVAPAPSVVVEAPADAPSATNKTGETPVDLGATTPVAGEAGPGDELIPLVQFDDADLLDVIRILARQAKINFQFDPKITSAVGPDGKTPIVQPRVSIRLENVTAKKVLEAVLQNHDMDLVPDAKTQIYRITFRQPGALPPLVTKVVQLNFSNPTNMSVLLKSTLSPRAQVIADTRTSQLVVMAEEKEWERIDELLVKLDSATKQVLIEGRIFETIENPQTIKGIDWSGTLEAQHVSFGNSITKGVYDFTKRSSTVTAPSAAEDTTLPSGRVIPGTSALTTTKTASTITDLALSSAVGSGMSWNTANGFTPDVGFLSADGVSAVLSFLNRQTDSELLATPRTVTLDNETATLEITKAYPIFQITPGSANSPAGANIQYTNLGTILTVNPRISGNSNITLKVTPEVSNIESKDTQTINGQVNIANIYAIRKMQTQVLIPSGGTLVMGGLMNDFKSKSYTKVPILGDIPILGLAFRQDGKKRQKQNLLIFITPTILRDTDFVNYNRTAFLQTQMTNTLGGTESAWDSGRPHDWKKKSKKNN